MRDIGIKDVIQILEKENTRSAAFLALVVVSYGIFSLIFLPFCAIKK